jgi:hypothetical protein
LNQENNHNDDGNGIHEYYLPFLLLINHYFPHSLGKFYVGATPVFGSLGLGIPHPSTFHPAGTIYSVPILVFILWQLDS